MVIVSENVLKSLLNSKLNYFIRLSSSCAHWDIGRRTFSNQHDLRQRLLPRRSPVSSLLRIFFDGVLSVFLGLHRLPYFERRLVVASDKDQRRHQVVTSKQRSSNGLCRVRNARGPLAVRGPLTAGRVFLLSKYLECNDKIDKN